MGGVGFITLLVLLHAFFLSICVVVGKDHKICSPSSCGDIRNISYPFRLKSDPRSCGFPEYELICENNRSMINLQEYYGGKYYEKYLVTQINYHNYTIRVVDNPGIVKKQNCWISSPLHSIAAFYTPYPYEFPYSLPFERRNADYAWPLELPIFYKIVLMKCEASVSQYDRLHSHCFMQHYRLSLFLITNICLCSIRRLLASRRNSEFMHRRHIYGYSTVEATS